MEKTKDFLKFQQNMKRCWITQHLQNHINKIEGKDDIVCDTIAVNIELTPDGEILVYFTDNGSGIRAGIEKA